MIRILFVDDEPKILEPLLRTLRGQRYQWEIALANSGKAALTLLEANPFDVVVADMQMPGMNGAALLRQVRDRFPDVVRIILTGYTELEAAFRAVPIAHQFLTKPCDPDQVRDALDRACRLKTLLNNEVICRAVGGVRKLPAMPSTYAALIQAIADPRTSDEEIAKIVEQDMAISTRVLQIVNSAFFGLAQEIASIGTAVRYLGLNALQNLVLSSEVFRAFQRHEQVEGFSLEELQSHVYLTAKIATALPGARHMSNFTVMAALLHDVGKLVLATKLREPFARALATARERACPLHVAEEELIGVTHAEVGAYLLGLWGLPCSIVETVAYHHTPSRAPRESFESVATVYVANILAHQHATKRPRVELVETPIDPQCLEELGVADRFPAWQAKAAELAHALAGA